MRWYRKAADRGEAGAECKLAAGYLLGFGVPQDDAEAVRWLRKAAAQGTASAQYKLGTMYQSGEGVSQDLGEAYFWLNLAAAAEKEPGRREEIAAQRDAAASNLTDQALLQTRERVRQWNAEHSLESRAQ